MASDPVSSRSWFSDLSKDGWLILLTCGVRTFGFGFLSVVLALYLQSLGLGTNAIGAILVAALAGMAGMTLIMSLIADQVGRRSMLMLASALMLGGALVFVFSSNAFLLALAAILGTISPSRDGGPFMSLEQAILPQVISPDRRTAMFGVYAVVSSFGAATGSLAVGLPHLVGLSEAAGFHVMLLAYAGIAALLLLIYAVFYSPSIEPPKSSRATAAGEVRRRFGLHKSQRVVFTLSGLMMLDSFAGGFIIPSLVALWFSLRYGTDLTSLGGIFFGTNLLSVVSSLLAAPLSKRIGLVNAMVSTHFIASVMLVLIPLMPSAEWAVAILLSRYLISELDVPARQAFVMQSVAVNERSAASGITAVSRNIASAVSPAFTGLTLSIPVLGLPFVVAAFFRTVYDGGIFVAFRHAQLEDAAPPSSVAVSRG